MVQILFLNVHAFLFAEFYVLWIADFNALLLAGKRSELNKSWSDLNKLWRLQSIPFTGGFDITKHGSNTI